MIRLAILGLAILGLVLVAAVAVNIWRAGRNLDKAVAFNRASAAYRRHDLAKGDRLKAQAEKMPLYDPWPRFRR